MTDDDVDINLGFTDEEFIALKSLAQKDTAAALEYAAGVVKDYKAAGRIASWMLTVLKWIVVMGGLVAAIKSGTITFFLGGK